MLSYQSLMPAAAGTPRFEKPELWRGTANWHGGFCYTPTPPPVWDKPTRYRIPAVARTTRPVGETGNHERDGKRLF